MEGATIHYKCKGPGCNDVDLVYASGLTAYWNAQEQEWKIDPNDLALADKGCLGCQSWEIEEYADGDVSMSDNGHIDAHPPVEPESVMHLHCILDTLMSCMDGSEEYCCSECVVNEVMEWTKEWLEVMQNDNNS